MSAEGIVWHFEIVEQATLKVPQMTLNTQTLLKKSVRGGIGIFYKYTLGFYSVANNFPRCFTCK